MKKCDVVDKCAGRFQKAEVKAQRTIRLIGELAEGFDDGAREHMVGQIQNLSLKTRLVIAQGKVAEGLQMLIEMHEECNELACDHGVGITDPLEEPGDLGIVVMGGAR